MGFIGLSSRFDNQEVTVIDPVETLEYILGDVRSQADFVVLLFNATEADIAKVRDSGMEIDLIVQSKSHRRSNDGGGYAIPTFSCGNRGKYIYQFEMEMNQRGRSFVDLSSYQSIISQMNRKLESALGEGTSRHSLERTPEGQRVLNEISKWEKKRDEAQKKLDSVVNSISFKRIDVALNISEEPSIQDIVEAGKKERINIMRPSTTPAAPFFDR